MHLALRLASSPCAQLVQQSGDDIISFLGGLFEELNQLSVNLPGLSYSLLVLAARQLLGDAQDLTEATQFLVACGAGCGVCPGSQAASAWTSVVESRAHVLEERLRQFASLSPGTWKPQPILARTRPLHEEADCQGGNFEDEGSPSGELEAPEVALKTGKALVYAEAVSPGRELRRGLLRVLEAGASPSNLLAASQPGEELVRPRWRRHELCEDGVAEALPKVEAFRDSSGLWSWQGVSARALLRRLHPTHLARRVYKVLPPGMQGSAECENAHGVLYDPTSCLEEEGPCWGFLHATDPIL
ncbi:hypothetical protein AK812_SmicGene35171 [Symbiodinium microadriaticum]|uniref:Uncharacterized protein n=1 Tax=Symbiodinium microadriaticum TaxID=2951 RepID=A0A1Q9CM72_SYMMI|nr:hypothetical protein AK812_SmicGene35171 [Symbiodinium microadriaticum]